MFTVYLHSDCDKFYFSEWQTVEVSVVQINKIHPCFVVRHPQQEMNHSSCMLEWQLVLDDLMGYLNLWNKTISLSTTSRNTCTVMAYTIIKHNVNKSSLCHSPTSSGDDTIVFNPCLLRLKGEFAVVSTAKICGRSLSSKIPVEMNSIFMKLYVRWPTWPKGHLPQAFEFSKCFL